MVDIICSAIVLDIEGTTSPARHVYDVLFPYARERMPAWVSAHADEAATRDAVTEVALAIGSAPDDLDAVVAQLVAWVDEDVKAAPLKTLQGLIWEQGYAAGELTSAMFDDVAPALRAWHADGLPLVIYSSGSVAAQKALFSHTTDGDLDHLITANFDITTAGPKREPSSYQRIAAELGVVPSSLLFLSDIQAEIDAANDAGWQAVGVLRPGEDQATATSDPRIVSFEELVVTRA